MESTKSKPGRAGVQFEQVAVAAARMQAEGLRPTSRAVRDAIGTGSLTTIQTHLSAWQATQPKPAPAELALSDSYKRALNAELQLHAAKATAALTEQLAEVVADRDAITAEAACTEAELAAVQGELATAQQTVATQAAQLDALHEQLVAAQARAETAMQAESTARAAAAEAGARAAAAEARANAAEERLKSAEAQAADAAARVAELTDKVAGLAAAQPKQKKPASS